MQKLAFILALACFSFGARSQTVDSLAYYSNDSIFRTDTVYEQVNIDGLVFSVKVLSARFDENGERYEDPSEDYFFSSAPVSLVFYDTDGAIVYAHKFDERIPSLEKSSGRDLSVSGKLFLHWYTQGMSGWLYETDFVSIEAGKVVLKKIMNTSELSFVLYNRNDEGIYVFHGIWDMFGETESHFSDHRYVIGSYEWREGEFQQKALIATKYRYSCPDEGVPVSAILMSMKKKEPGLLKDFHPEDYREAEMGF